MRNLLTAIAFLLVVASTAAAQKCLAYERSVTLTGTLHSRVFAGPPNWESISRGDRKETAILLKLDEPTCTTGNDWPDVSYPDVRGMQLVIHDEQWKTVKQQKGKRVVVTGTLFGAHTGHHRTNVLIDMTAIRAASATDLAVRTYPSIWFAPVNDPNKPDWEILPEEANSGEVILSKRNELGILSNFAATLFEFYDNRYASVKGFWQSER